eukprot:CAMPEP_0204835082 /NCGR_PEP_ID=MMETSP1346-20131115/21559_1 /ASSEMBLY_ACC=CAM_ASM_000771 /TAXON_ID=215587 /ORGANISM="Aplanochytrium stocchinoi, Strain GSBS06" /LENGTH=226 /DNA_ID=CAMNT_0051968785 /DNA_START=127 /DNA_END=804 /DNA_ORIENTATION=+
MASQLRSRPVAKAGAAVDMNELQYKATRLKLELEGALNPEVLRKPSKDPIDFEQVATKFESFRKLVDKIESLIPSQRQPQQRDIWKKRVESYKENIVQLNATLHKKKESLNMRRYENDQRALLFGHRDDESIEMRDMFQDFENENESLQNSNKTLMQTLSQATATLDELRDQGKTIFSSSTKLSDIANRLGMVNSLLRVIDRKEYGNKMIVFGGMFLILLIVILVW